MSRSASFYVLFPVCSTSSVWKQITFHVFHVFSRARVYTKSANYFLRARILTWNT